MKTELIITKIDECISKLFISFIKKDQEATAAAEKMYQEFCDHLLSAVFKEIPNLNSFSIKENKLSTINDQTLDFNLNKKDEFKSCLVEMELSEQQVSLISSVVSKVRFAYEDESLFTREECL